MARFVKRDGNSVADVVFRNTGIPTDEFLIDVRNTYIANLDEAVAFAKHFIQEHPGCTVTIVGDYDVDGDMATAIMYWAFMSIGVTPVLRLPRRFSEGYGLSEKIIDEIPSGLLITVDNGIAAHAAIKKAKEKGLAVIVTDHHLPSYNKDKTLNLPDADVIVDPHMDDRSEFKDYCGAAIAYRFAQKLLGKNSPELLVLASIATVADVMPLIGPNRTLVRDGLQYINRRRVVPGLGVLLDAMEMDNHIHEGDYGFKLGPVFNAPGRLYDDGAIKSVNLLCSKKNSFASTSLANGLVQANKKRKAIVADYMSQVEQMVSADDKPIVVYLPRANEGVIGIIAGNLTEAHHCPAIVFTDSHDGILKGSGRSISEIHLKDSLDKIKEHILGYGGHAGAAGLSIRKDNFRNFKAAFKDAIGPIPAVSDDIPYDLELDLTRLEETCAELSSFAPYGEGNPQVRFRLRCTIDPANYRKIGDGTHFMVKTDKNVTIMGFGLVARYEAAGSPRDIDCVGHLSESWFRDKKSYKFEIIDFLAV